MGDKLDTFRVAFQIVIQFGVNLINSFSVNITNHNFELIAAGLGFEFVSGEEKKLLVMFRRDNSEFL